MLTIIRIRTGFKRIEVVGDYILEHQRELQNDLGDKGKLVYLTKRARHEDTTLHSRL